MSNTKPTATPIYIESDEKYRLEMGEICFECTPRDSGRIVTFAVDGHNVLTPPSVNPFNFGSTFWTAPQSDWDWPPPAALDSDAPYEAAVEDDTVVMRGAACPKLGVRITKRYRADSTRNRIHIEYKMTNTGDKPVTYAPWEISRVAPGGLTFYPTGEGALAPSLQSPLPVEESHGITWFHHTPQTVTDQHKCFADGKEGWIAHVDKGLLFIKTFEDHPMAAAAPGEAEIEIYAVPEYVEVEQQGAYKKILPEETYVWSLYWYLCCVPSGVAVPPGNPALADLVRRIIAG